MTADMAYKEPLTVDPVLWAALEKDRQVAPWGDLSCDTCGRPRRPRGTLAADHPGTLSTHSHGRCHSCANGKDWKRTPRPRVCVIETCGVALRGNGVPLAEEPGTRKHAGAGMCTTCYGKNTRNKKGLS